MKIFFTCVSFLVLSFHLYSQHNDPDPHYQPLNGDNYVQSKNYYFLTLLQYDKEARILVEKDPALSSLAKQKQANLKSALDSYNNKAAIITAKMKFTNEEIALVGERLRTLYKEENALGRLVRRHLIPSGAYIRFVNSRPQDLLAKAWEQDAKGINFAIGVYGEGEKPNYPNIDSISFDAHGKQLASLMYTAAYGINAELQENSLFFLLSLYSALRLLEINDRWQAADFEPMAETVNKAAAEKIKTVNWNKYPYTLILIPGAGPDEYGVKISAEARLRLRLGALQYQKGMAPFIVVSGGKIHPYKTKYCEALEMKKFLVETLHIPESAVIMEPHARHTTTNMRNTVRLIFHYGMPMNRPCITATSRYQSAAIEKTLAARCLQELDEVPYKNGKRLSETEVEFYPLTDALHIDPMEPVDP
ncbi:hypothetical protein A8C56_08795 [Niabella ginsenosidivorans]|uniref:DUF218 domain-containing protein n=1 Tax=Niabella ginsenosidivorans TaxID=1176587 RepID=A0A1A9I0M4_9BACT|nr:ElyC/SanA/YdcF family protein [Niabella ginsenosidivorans]ANH81063.1 hypothetical protein A8C56_08795 [Niabella ginsenosidivorans]